MQNKMIIDRKLYQKNETRNTWKKKSPGSIFGIFYFFQTLVFWVLVFAAALPAASHADEITWIRRHFPPINILEGPYKDQGQSDLMLQLLIRNLPQYEHNEVVCNMKRAEELLRTGSHVVRLTMFKNPEREAFMYFSLPHIMAPSHKLVIRAKDYPVFLKYMDENQTVSLENLLGQDGLKMGVEANRRFGKDLDMIFDKNSKNSNIIVRNSSNTDGLVTMLLRKRFDYLVEYPWSITFTMKSMGQNPELLKTLELKESGGFSIGHAVAPKTPWGKKVIEEINEILKKHRPTDEYREFMERWLDKDSIPGFRKAYAQMLEPE